MRIKLVLFDAFDTIVTPRLPVHVQYASVFAPYFTLDPAKIKPSFKKGSYLSSYNKMHLAKLSKHSSKCRQNSRHIPVDPKAFRGLPMVGGGKSLSALLSVQGAIQMVSRVPYISIIFQSNIKSSC